MVKSLSETVGESEIVDLEEVINEPNIIIDDDYGILYDSTNDQCVLVNKTIANRTGKEEDGENCGKVLRYVRWVKVGYYSNEYYALMGYKSKSAKSKLKKLKNVKNFEPVVEVYKEIDETIKRCMNVAEMPPESKVNNLIKKLEARIKLADKILSKGGF